MINIPTVLEYFIYLYALVTLIAVMVYMIIKIKKYY